MRHLVVLSSLLLAGGFSAMASVDSGLLALVPSGAKIVGSLDVTQARHSEFGQYLLGKMQSEDGHFQEMISETGFDPRRDLQTILFEASGPGAASAGMSSSFAILARGNFDVARIKTLATSKGGATIVTYGGIDMLVTKDGSHQQKAVAFPETGIAVMADLTTLKQMIDSRAAPSVLDPDLISKINTVGANNDAWFVSLVGGAFLADHAAAPQAKALQGVVQSSGGVKLGSTIQTTFDAVARSPQDATSLSDVIRFMASMVQLQRQNNPQANILAGALDSMTLETTGAAVHFAVALPEKSLEQIADMTPHSASAPN